MQGYDQGYRAVSGFIRDTKSGHWLRDRGYLGAAELHPKGHGYHWHLGVKGGTFPKPMVNQIRREWSKYLWEHHREVAREGARDVRTHVKRFHSAKTAGRYLSKYISKTFGEGLIEPGRHRYIRSEGLEEPALSTYGYPERDLAIEHTFARAYSASYECTYVYDGVPEDKPIWFAAFDPP